VRLIRLGEPWGGRPGDDAEPVTDQQVAFVPRQAERGTAVGEVFRKMGIPEATFCRWRRKFGRLMPPEVRRLRHLEEENARLRRLVADLGLDRERLQEVARKKLRGPSGWGDRRAPADLLPRLCPARVPGGAGAAIDVPLQVP